MAECTVGPLQEGRESWSGILGGIARAADVRIVVSRDDHDHSGCPVARELDGSGRPLDAGPVTGAHDVL